VHDVGTRRPGITLVALVTAITTPACTGGEPDPSARSALGDDTITIGSFDFAESVVVAEIYGQALEARGYPVERALALGPREFVAPAMAAGLIEFVPEYSGTASEFASLGVAEPSGDAGHTHEELLHVLGDGPVAALAAAPAQSVNTFVVTEATAEEHALVTLSDLGPVAAGMTFGGPPECAARPLCLAGLVDIYGLRFEGVTVLDTGGPLTRQALRSGGVDVALLFTTDPGIAEEGFVELVDDRGLQPAENVTPLVRSEVIDEWGQGIVDVIDSVSSRLTTAAVRELNAALGRAGETPAAVAARWLEREGLS